MVARCAGRDLPLRRSALAAHRPFRQAQVQWYGGDPSLALDVVEVLSARLIALCDERGSAYEAMMLTNCNDIDEEAVGMLARMRVKLVYMTIDGFEDTHNARRVSATGSNSYERNIEAARLFARHGIKAKATMNVDRVNWPEFHPLRDHLRDELGIELSCARLCDYGHFFGTRDFKKPAFDLFEHEEFSRPAARRVRRRAASAGDDIRAMLGPCRAVLQRPAKRLLHHRHDRRRVPVRRLHRRAGPRGHSA